MFAVHYFFGCTEHLRNFATNVAQVLRPGGCFVGVCLDGDRVDALLQEEKARKVGDRVEGKNTDGNKVIWSIERKYEGVTFDRETPWNNVGREISVFMETIGHAMSEFLVDYRLLVLAMAEVKMFPMSTEQSAAYGLGRDSTGHFDTAFSEMSKFAENTGKKNLKPNIVKAMSMAPDEKRYSFLNRWFVFRKEDAETVPLRIS
jgi:hypothetical protein